MQGGGVFNNRFKGECKTNILSLTFYGNNAGIHGGAVAEYNLFGTCSTNVRNTLFSQNTNDTSDTSLFSEFYTHNSSIEINYCVIQLDTQKYKIGIYNKLTGLNNLYSSDANVDFKNTNDWKGNDGIWGTSDDGLIPTNTITNNGGDSKGTTVQDINNATRGTNPDIGASEH